MGALKENEFGMTEGGRAGGRGGRGKEGGRGERKDERK